MLDVEHTAAPFIQELALPIAVYSPPSSVVIVSLAINPEWEAQNMGMFA